MSTFVHKRRGMVVGAAVLVTLGLAACSGGTDQPGSTGTGGETTAGGAPAERLTMWARAATASQSQALVDAWNASHDQKVELTVVPTDNYLQKVGVAAGSNDLPCLMASDVVYMPNFTSKNLYVDIADRIAALPFADQLAKGHLRLASDGDAVYGVPHNVAVSAIFQNDVVLEKAGIDPTAELGSLEELASNAAKVAALGDDYTGLYFTGANGGSISFTHFPAIWASGAQVLSDDGQTSLLDSDTAIGVFEVFNQMYRDGSVPESVKSESGATRNEVFATGKVGYMLASNSVLETVEESDDLKIGVQGIPGLGGGVSAYVGGDAIGITTSCGDVDGAWDFLSWTLSEDAQVGVFAKMNQLTVRADLAENEYSTADPRVVRLNELVGLGDTPKALNYGPTFNDLNGPALGAFTAALFGDDVRGALTGQNAAITASLQG